MKYPHPLRFILLSAFLLPGFAEGQDPSHSPAEPAAAKVASVPALSGEAEIKAGLPTPPPEPKEQKPAVSPEPPLGSAAKEESAKPKEESAKPKGEIRLNFQNASLADVLNYLSEAAGFIVVQDAQVAGTVNIVSKQAITPDEAVDLLNAVLAEKGYTAIRNNRILKIVSRNTAQKRDIPVVAGSDPAQIPRKDGVVTQILPIRYVDAVKLVENLRPLLSSEATISANEASNSILLGDTQTNIHRIAEIIHALDNSVASISTLRVFHLQFADCKSLASVLSQLFSDGGANGGNQQGGRGGRFAYPGFPGMPGGGASQPDQSKPSPTGSHQGRGRIR